ncbi:MAG: hypothetical protein EBX52_04035 [Proteobacteria bacterium]|nr:hypothetical protein [Pseudomonadota bacterium]
MKVSKFILVLVIALASAQAHAKAGDLISRCSHLLDRIIGAVGIKFDLPAGTRNFQRELGEIAIRFDLKRVKFRTPDYLDRVYSEWVELGDPEYHLSVLKYPVPVSVLEVLTSAIENRISPEALNKLAQANAARPGYSSILHFCSIILRNPRFDHPEELEAWVRRYQTTREITRDGISYLTGVPYISDVPSGKVRLYKGTNFYKGPAVSKSMAGKPLEEILDGGEYFLDRSEARIHSIRAEAFHKDGVSVSKDKTVILNYGSYVRIYDIPDELFKQLPAGEPGLGEYVFRYSIPERYRVMTLPKATWLEVLKFDQKAIGPLARSVQQSTIVDDPVRLIALLKAQDDPILLRGRRLSLAEIFRGPSGAMNAPNLEQHTLMGYKQMDVLMPKFNWAEIPDPPNVNIRRTIRFAYSLHDSGKPLAFEIKSPDMHEEFSAEILGQVMTRAGFTMSEVELAKALIGTDAIGLMIRGEKSPQEAYEELLRFAKQTNLTPREFFKVQTFYYTVDASSYPELKARLFREENGMLVPNSEKYQVLKNLFDNLN